MNQYACAITGHRPTRFCFGYNEEDPLCQKLKECLLEQFRILHDEKFVRTFFVGGALGVDMWAGEQLLTLRAQTGYEDIKIIVVIPFIGYDSKWPDSLPEPVFPENSRSLPEVCPAGQSFRSHQIGRAHV